MEKSPGTQLPGRPWCEGQKLRTASGTLLVQGLPCGEELAKEKGSKMMSGGPGDRGGDWKRKRPVHFHRLPHKDSSTLQPSLRRR